MRIEPLICPDAFVGLAGVTHLAAGGEAPWLKEHDDVYLEFSRVKGGGDAGRQSIRAYAGRCRESMSRLWGVPPQRIVWMPSSAEGMNSLARGLDWRPGDNVVTSNLEFPSVAYAWKNCEHVEVRMVPH